MDFRFLFGDSTFWTFFGVEGKGSTDSFRFLAGDISIVLFRLGAGSDIAVFFLIGRNGVIFNICSCNGVDFLFGVSGKGVFFLFGVSGTRKGAGSSGKRKKKTPNDAVTPQRQSQFMLKMKAKAVSRLLSSLV